MSNRAFAALYDRFAHVASTAKTKFNDRDLDFIYGVRHCPSRSVLVDELRKSTDWPTPIIKHAMACKHCAFELAMALTAMDGRGKSIFDGIIQSEESDSLQIGDIRVGDVCTIRPEGWTRDDYVTEDAGGNVCYHAPVDVVVVFDPTDLGTVSVAQVGYVTKFIDDGDIAIPGFDAAIVEAWNVYTMPLSDLVPTGTRVSDEIVAKVCQWTIGAGRDYPSPESENGRQYKFLEINAGSFFSSRCNFRRLDAIENAEDQS